MEWEFGCESRFGCWVVVYTKPLVANFMRTFHRISAKSRMGQDLIDIRI